MLLLRQQGITGGLVKGALSVAASAYKALFTGQGPTQVSSPHLTFVSVLFQVLESPGFKRILSFSLLPPEGALQSQIIVLVSFYLAKSPR